MPGRGPRSRWETATQGGAQRAGAQWPPQRTPSDPAAHAPSPTATGDARRSDERRRQDELEGQAVQRGLAADGFHDVFVLENFLGPSTEDDLAAVDRIETVGDACRVDEVGL